MRTQQDSDCLVAAAKSIGFDLCAIFPANELAVPAHRDEWLARGYAGHMNYLRDERRANPLAALPEAKSVIVCAVNYNTAQPYSTEASAAATVGEECRAWISRYAWGEDYHTVIGEMLERLLAAIQKQFPADNFLARSYVDTGPISERLAAHHAGFGWLAKNTCLINEDLGSWLFLGVILTSLELSPAPARVEAAAPVPPPDLCGNCTLCLDACPTDALAEPYVLDASRCISYLTIELRDSVPESLRPAMGWQVFGCDICQDVCPWNRRAPHTQIAAFTPRENRVAPALDWLLSLSEEDFRRAFKNSPVRRAKWRGLLRNACIAAGNARNSSAPRLRSRLAELADSSDSLIAEHARWALARIDAAAAPPAAPPSRLIK
jgi:epoxyqueuosine reductase